MQLDKWLEKNGISQGDFGLKLDPPKTQGQVSHYITGHTPIPLMIAAQIQRLTGGDVAVTDWIRQLQRQEREAATPPPAVTPARQPAGIR